MTAAEKILQKTLVGSNLDSSEWNRIQAGLRDRAFFSSQVQSAKILYAAREISARSAAGSTDISKARMEMREALAGAGYTAAEGEEGTIKDLTSKTRLDAIIKTNVAQARGYVQYLDANTPGGYMHAPAQELHRYQERKQKRDWVKRWTDAGGKLFGGRMIALKDDPIWTRISVFGNPFPPFDWGSGMGLRNVTAREAMELGIISKEALKAKVAEKREAEKTGRIPGMNDSLSTEVPFKGDTPEMRRLEDAFGDQITHKDGRIVWRGDIVQRAFDEGKPFKIRLGKPSNRLRSLLPESAGKILKDKSFTVDGGWLDEPRLSGDSHRSHFGPDEKDARNMPLTKGDLDLIPALWRNPDRVDIGGYNGAVICNLETFDGGTLRMVVDILKVPRIKSLYKNKPGIGSGGLT